jgi:hypothetical protein
MSARCLLLSPSETLKLTDSRQVNAPFDSPTLVCYKIFTGLATHVTA